MARKYTREEATQAVGELIEVVQKKVEEPHVLEDFIERHPWALKYLGHREEEAEALLQKVRTGMAKIIDISECQRKLYLKEMLVFFVNAPIGREILLRFEKQDDGSYVALRK